MARSRLDPALDTTIECTAHAPGEARRAVEDLALSLPLLRDVQLIVSELVTNSVRHSGSGDDIRLRAWLRLNGVKVEIADGGGGFETEHDRSADDEGGRGLLILDALAKAWGVTAGSPTRVWFEIAHPPAGRARAS